MKLICYLLVPEKYPNETFRNTIDTLVKISSLQEEICFALFYDSNNLKILLDEASLSDEINEQNDYHKIEKIQQISKYHQKYQDSNAFYGLWNQNTCVIPVKGSILADITERILQNHDTEILLINIGNVPTDRKNCIPIFKDFIKDANLPKFAFIHYVSDVNELRKWIYKNITLKELSPDAYKLVCKELENPNSLLSATLRKLDFDTWKPSEDYFPLIQFSNYLFENQNVAKRKPTNFIEINPKWAIINGYTKNDCVTDDNKKPNNQRLIFSAGRDDKRIYLSLDFENANFEVHDYEGTHLGAFGYDGLRKANAKSESHSITVPKKCR